MSTSSTLYLSFGDSGAIFRGRPNNQANSGPLAPETSGVSDALYQAAANNNPVSGGDFTVMAVGSLGHIIRSNRQGNASGTWSTVYTASGPTALYAITYGNGVWIAAGQGDTVLRSTDNGTTWTRSKSGQASVTWKWAAYGNGTFMLVGGPGGKVSFSTNGGITWEKGSGGTTSDLTSVAYSPELNRFVAVGTDGAVVVVKG